MNQPAQKTFVDELCDSRPSSRIMLREAWDGLSPETQMAILFRVTTDRSYPVNADLLAKALASPNAYLRHLVVRSGWMEATSVEDEADKAILRASLEDDPSALVQGALVHRDAYSRLVGLGPDPKQLCDLPLEARLTVLRRARHPVDWFPKVMRRAMAIGLPRAEVHLMTEEYLASHVAVRFGLGGPDGWSERDAQRGLAELWRLAAQLHEGYVDSALLLINRLPGWTAGPLAECIPEDALLAMSEEALVVLLRRPDVKLAAFRGALLVREQAPGDELLEAAASRPVAIPQDEFAKLLTMPDRIPALEYCEGLPPVMIRALKDCYRFKYGHARFGELTDYSNQTLRSQLARLPPAEQRETVKELRKYQLATILSPWPNQLPSVDEFSRSLELIDRGKPGAAWVSRLQRPKALAVPGDPWATYCNFGRYFDIRENYEALRHFSSGYYPDDVTDVEVTG